MARSAELRRLLLGLTCGRSIQPLPLAPADWRKLCLMAEQHRLEPVLHARFDDRTSQLAPPPDVRERWRAAYRTSGLIALAIRKEALDTAALLAQHGIRAVALKGAYAAWHAYPKPALRPMRDIDFLVAKDQALQAFKTLAANGYRQEEPGPRTLRESLDHDKHLPPLLGPSGIRIELHMRLWERSEAIGRAMPADESAAMFTQAEPVTASDPLFYLQREDRLVHCIVHGAYSNRLDGGPLTLLDLAALVGQGGIEWPRFWHRAEQEGWSRGAALLMQLADFWCEPGLAKRVGTLLAVEPELIDAAPEMLLQDPADRKAVGVMTSLRESALTMGLAGMLGTARQRLAGTERPQVAIDSVQQLPQSRTGWATRRVGETLRSVSRPQTLAVAKHSARLGRWLDAGA